MLSESRSYKRPKIIIVVCRLLFARKNQFWKKTFRHEIAILQSARSKFVMNLVLWSVSIRNGRILSSSIKRVKMRPNKSWSILKMDTTKWLQRSLFILKNRWVFHFLNIFLFNLFFQSEASQKLRDLGAVPTELIERYGDLSNKQVYKKLDDANRNLKKYR